MTIKDILLPAGEILAKRYSAQTCHSVNKRYHLLSEVDVEMNDFITAKILKEYPNDSIYSEESPEIVKNSGRRWIVDPIDGTTNFITGNPYFAISVALESDGRIIEGHVYNPVSDEYYFASCQEDAAWLNGEKISVSTTAEIADSIIAFGYSANMKIINEYYSQWKTVFDTCKKGVPWNAPALSICNVARGRVDAFIDTGSSMEGQAAASLILEKAGGVMFDTKFTPYSYRTTGGVFCSRAILENLKNS